MTYTPQQRDIIRRIGEVSRAIDQLRAEHRTAQAAQVAGIAETTNGLTAAIAGLNRSLQHLNLSIRQSDEMSVLIRRHGDLWREFLDTL